MKSPLTILAVIALTLASCSGVKNLTGAQTDDMPAVYSSGIATDDTLTIADIEWWRFYSDSILSDMISRTLANNRDLLRAAARVEQMRALAGINKSNYLPQLTAMAGGSHETNDYNGSGTTYDPEADLKVTLGWEADLWGSLTWARRKGVADYMASVEEMRAMRMTLIAEVAEAYFRLLALENELTIVKQTLRTRQESLEWARIRFEGGLTSETVYQQAKVEYSTTASLIPDLDRRITLARNSLSLLMGEYPDEQMIRGRLPADYPMPPMVNVGVPSQLLERRPDLRAAEQRLASSMAGVGVAYANRFPTLRIGLTAGFENDGLRHFFESPFTYAIGSITGTILDFGRNKKKYQAAIAAYEQSRYAYEQSVIRAFTEVHNAIVTYRRVHEAHDLKIQLRDAAGKYVALATIQYRAGTVNYIDVLDAQRRYFDAQISVSNALRDEYLALIELYKTLGGGWNYQSADGPAANGLR